jgi:hypothetical protein
MFTRVCVLELKNFVKERDIDVWMLQNCCTLNQNKLKFVPAVHGRADPGAVQYKAWVCESLLSGIAGSSPVGYMDISLLRVMCVVR